MQLTSTHQQPEHREIAEIKSGPQLYGLIWTPSEVLPTANVFSLHIYQHTGLQLCQSSTATIQEPEKAETPHFSCHRSDFDYIFKLTRERNIHLI